MLLNRIKDPGLSELDNKIAAKLSDYRGFMKRAEENPSFLVDAASAYVDMDSLLELRTRATKKAR